MKCRAQTETARLLS